MAAAAPEANVSANGQSTWPVTKALAELMKEKHAQSIFGAPVDAVALNLPTYHSIIKHPMDLGTVQNAMTFNPVGNQVHLIAKRLLARFETLLKPEETGRSTGGKRPASSMSTSNGSAPAQQMSAGKQPKRDDETKHSAGVVTQSDTVSTIDKEACTKLLTALLEHDCAEPFLKPVDPVELEIPHYTTIITQPMDLNTVKRKLKSDQYLTNAQFRDDVNLIWENCYKFNGTPEKVGVSRMALLLQQKFQRSFQRAGLDEA